VVTGANAGERPYVIAERRVADPQRDRIRLSVLAEIGLLLASNEDHHAILQRVAALAVPALADRCTVYLRGKGDVLDRVAVERADASAVVTSQMAVPMHVRDRVLGVLVLARTSDPPYSVDDLAFAEELARRVAMYVDHALLLRDQALLIHELEQTNRDLDQFADVASHDLKAPLRGIATLAQVLESDLGERLDDASRNHLELLRGRVRRLEAMIDGWLRYSRAGRVVDKPVEVDVGALVRDVLELLGPSADVAIEIGDLPTLHTVRQPLEQVLLNLIGNALKHGGRSITIGGAPVQGGWEMFVRDDGCGIAPELHDEAWGMFRTLKPRDAVEGSGMGLAIVRRIVESMGGRVGLESQVGAGATFRFVWPSTTRRRRRASSLAR
jgi:signal transduction histidine kinase